MDILTILKKPFIIPSLLAGLIVAFRIALLFVQYVQKRYGTADRNRREPDCPCGKREE